MEVIQDGDVPVIATRLELKEVEAAVFNFATNDYTTGQSEGSNVSTGNLCCNSTNKSFPNATEQHRRHNQ